MNAEQVIELIQSLEPKEIERLFVLIKEYEAEVRRRQASACSVDRPVDENFDEIVDEILTRNSELFRKLAEFEAEERAKK